MPNQADDVYLRLQYPVIVQPEAATDGTVCYRAWHPDLHGCMAQGETIDEAIGSLDEARRLYILALRKRGIEVPLPSASLTDSGNISISTSIWTIWPVTQYPVEEQITTIPFVPAG